jgi:peptide/nickel transport system substrate-binding protein
MKIKKQGLLVVVLPLLLILGCKQNINEGSHDIVIRLANEPEHIHPILFPNALAREVYQYIFNPLTEINSETLELDPILLTSVPEMIIDGEGRYSIEAEIRQEATWEDGSPVTGYDYLFTIKMVMHPLTGADAYRPSIEVISDIVVDKTNPKKFKIIFEEYQLLMKENALTIEVLPQYVYDAAKLNDIFTLGELKDTARLKALESDSSFVKFAEMINDPKYSHDIISGSGPYKLDSWQSGQGVVLVQKDNFWGETSSLASLASIPNRIIFTILPDENAAMAQLSTGEIDVMNSVTNETYKVFNDSSKNKDNIDLMKVQMPKYYFLLMNHQRPLMSDKAVRQALSLLVNVDQYIDVFENGDGTKLTSFVPPFMPGYNKVLKPRSFDLEKAKSILEAAGWNDSNSNAVRDKMVNGKLTELNLVLYASGALSSNLSLLLKDAAAKAGIAIDVIQKDFATIRKEHLKTGDFDMVPSVASLDVVLDDPYGWFHSDNAGEGNLFRYSNATADSLINIIRSEPRMTEVIKAHHELQAKLYDDVVGIYLYAPKDRIALSKDWIGSPSLRRPGYQANNFKIRK